MSPTSSADSSSWSDGRGGGSESKAVREKERLRRFMEAAGRIDGALAQLASDRDFQQDLRVVEVAKALKHWTGRERLGAAEAEKLFDVDSYHFRTHIRPCLAKLARLQHECKQADVVLPLDRILGGHRTLMDLPGANPPKPKEKKTKKGAPEKPAPNANDGAKTAAAKRRQQGWRELIWWLQAYGFMLIVAYVCFVAYIQLTAPDETAFTASSGTASGGGGDL